MALSYGDLGTEFVNAKNERRAVVSVDIGKSVDFTAVSVLERDERAVTLVGGIAPGSGEPGGGLGDERQKTRRREQQHRAT